MAELSDDAPTAPALDPNAVRSLFAKLELPAAGAEAPDPNRLLALVEILVDFILPVHQLTWTTWRTLAPGSAVRRTGNLQRALAGFLSGEESSPHALAAELHRLRQLTASLVSAVGRVGHQVTTNYLSRFQPAEVAQVVASESRGGLFQSQAARCWRKYLELSEMLDSAAVEAEIRRVIATHVEELMKERNP